MKMRGFWYLGLFMVLYFQFSCSFFSSEEKRVNKIVAKEMERIDWNALDHYPLFAECDELMTKPTQKKCFENTIISYLTEKINGYNLELLDSLQTVVYVDLLVDREGTIRIVDMERNNEALEQIPEFNRMIQREINALPQVEPALKRGVPVNVKFRIPIELNTN